MTSPDLEAPALAARQRIRYTPTALIPLIVGLICAFPLAAALGWWGLLFAVPFALAIALWIRLGMDIEPEVVHVRGALSTLSIPRSDIVGFAMPNERHVALVRRDSSTVHIPTVRPRDLPMLRISLFGHDVPHTEDTHI